jgi:Mg-chelatase subunit ChlD
LQSNEAWLAEIDRLQAPGGMTDLSGAIDEAIRIIETRTNQSRGVLVFLATDGLNNDLANPNNVDSVSFDPKKQET